tara:strand:+ start:148 stop:387 length:240 start_codon:yes stop_codon:yes gene_type:complete
MERYLKELDAKKAVEITENNGRFKLEHTLELIKDAAYRGHKGIKREGFMLEETIEELKKRGFSVRVKKNDFSQVIEIMW